jgi:hypothetical protein
MTCKLPEIVLNSNVCSFFFFSFLQKVPIGKKFYIVYNFFIARRFISAFFTFFFFSLLLPVRIFFSEITDPGWELVLVPTVITLLNSVGTPRYTASFFVLLFSDS